MEIDAFSLERIMRKAESSYYQKPEQRSFLLRYASSVAILFVMLIGIFSVTGRLQQPQSAALLEQEEVIWVPSVDSTEEEIIRDGWRYYYSHWKNGLVAKNMAGSFDTAGNVLSDGLMGDSYADMLEENGDIYFTRTLDGQHELMRLDTKTGGLEVLHTHRTTRYEWPIFRDGSSCRLKGKLGDFLVFSVENETYSVLYAYHMVNDSVTRLSDNASESILGTGDMLITSGELGGVYKTRGPLYLHDLAAGESRLLTEYSSGAIRNGKQLVYLECTQQTGGSCILVCHDLETDQEVLRKELPLDTAQNWRLLNNCFVSESGIGKTLLVLPSGFIAEYPDNYVCFCLGVDNYFAATEDAIYTLNPSKQTKNKLMDLTTGTSPWGYRFCLKDDRVFLTYQSTEQNQQGEFVNYTVSWSKWDFGIQ